MLTTMPSTLEETLPSTEPATLSWMLSRRAHDLPGNGYTFLLDGEQQIATWSYRQLDARARAIAGALQRRAGPGDYPPDPARLDRTLPRLLAIIRSSQPRFILTVADALPYFAALTDQASELAAIEVMATDQSPPGGSAAWSAGYLASRCEAVLKGSPMTIIRARSESIRSLAATLLSGVVLITLASGCGPADEGLSVDEVAALSHPLNSSSTPAVLSVKANLTSGSGTKYDVELIYYNNGGKYSCILHNYFSSTGESVSAGSTQSCNPVQYSNTDEADDTDYLLVGFTEAQQAYADDGLLVTAVSVKLSNTPYIIDTFNGDGIGSQSLDCTGCDLSKKNCNSCWIDASGHNNCTQFKVNMSGSNNTWCIRH